MKLNLDPEVLGTASWTDALKKGELLGGPSKWGNSRYSTLKQCPYYYWWTYIKRMIPIEHPPELEIGGLFHEVMARYFQTYLDMTTAGGELKSSSEEVDRLCLASGYDLLERTAEHVPATTGTVKRMWQQFLSLYGPGSQGDFRDRIMGVEGVIAVDDPLPYSARLDLWAWDLDKDGPYIIEIKTSSRRSTALVESYKMDSQFLGHQWLWKKSGTQRKWGPLVDYQVLLVTRAADAYIGFETVPLDEARVKDYEKELRDLYAEIVSRTMSKSWPRRRTWRCRRGGKACPLFDHCAYGIDTSWRRKRRGEP